MEVDSQGWCGYSQNQTWVLHKDLHCGALRPPWELERPVCGERTFCQVQLMVKTSSGKNFLEQVRYGSKRTNSSELQGYS